MPPAHKCCDELSKRQEPHMTYERRILLVPRQGAMHSDPEVLQMLWNKRIVKNISPMPYNIITKSVKYIKPIIHTYLSLLRDEACSMLVLLKGLKQGDLGVPAYHLTVQQYRYVRLDA
jgi:hypothetical protein